jgi:quercetin dioxygenase-like cupin family protein
MSENSSISSDPNGNREPRLDVFLSSVAEGMRTRALSKEGAAVMAKIYDALEKPGRCGQRAPRQLPVCEHLSEALDTARAHSEPLAQIADSLSALVPLLFWAPRAATGPFASDNWPEGHANATIVGPNGLENRNDLHIGVSLLAPHVRYPDHKHAPEEVYLVLSRGRFQHGSSSWFEPGVGGTLYNEPNIKHAMASDDAPLLALWFLWMGSRGGPTA